MSSLVLATAGYDHTIRFWEATTGICWRTIPHNDSHVNKLEISQDKRWLAAAGNPSVRVYDIQSNTNNPFCTFNGHTGNVSAIGFNKEGRWLYSGTTAHHSQRRFSSLLYMCDPCSCWLMLVSQWRWWPPCLLPLAGVALNATCQFATCHGVCRVRRSHR